MDVAVVGGGIVGASIAWRLAQRGASVELFEAGVLGGEASYAGAGMLAPGAEITTPGAWSDLALESLAGYPSFLTELMAETGIAVDYRAMGAIELAFDVEDWDQLRARASRQREMGILSEEWSSHEVEDHVPGMVIEGMTGALFYPGDAIVDPRDVTRALRHALTTRGAVLREHYPVSSIRDLGGSVEIECAAATHQARLAVLAAGAWSSRIGVSVAQIPASIPVRGHLIGWRLPPGSLGPIIRHHHTYILQRMSGFTIAGTSEERVGFDRAVDPAIAAAIATRARALLPALLSREPDETWIGFRPGTESGEPAIGRLHRSSIWLAYGHYRNGILMAPATARRIADQITSN